MEVITLPPESHTKGYGRSYKPGDWCAVRYVASGRKGYLKHDTLEGDFVVVGAADPDARWTHNPRKMFPDGTIQAESAAALELLRERDIAKVRKRILDAVHAPSGDRMLKSLNPSSNALAALDQAIHMILAGV